MSQEYILEMTDIVKEFPGVRALKGVQLKVRPGTVHTLMGENGAGKSTLMKCLIGIHPPTSGKIVFEGKEIQFKNTLEALNSGISMIHQELSPVPERSVCENLWLGRAPRKGLIIDHKKMRQDSIELFNKLNLDVDPDEKMGNLTVAKMQMVEIAKAVSYDSRIVIMDEPTSSLTDAEVEQAAKMASAHSFIMRLENGYDTMIEGDGANLSQGQRQLLNIARAAISKAPVLILDEATSSVDTRTERHIEHGMDRLMADRTTLVIAHRLSTVRNANAIMVLENGEIIERGDHDQLLEQKGRYYELYTGKKQLA